MYRNCQQFIVDPPSMVRREHPLSRNAAAFIDRSRDICRALLTGKDPRIVFVVGPCSVHSASGLLAYAKRLKQIAVQIQDWAVVVMRAYVEKSRTHKGWKGWVYEPDLDGIGNMQKGLSLSRQLFLHLTELEIPLAMEIVDPLVFPYLEDLISWGFVGARSVASQVHRQFISSLSFPVGFKNALDGDIEVAIHSIQAAREKHAFLGINEQGTLASFHSEGNSHTHLVLRGSLSETNFHPAAIENAWIRENLADIDTRILIDCAHGNSQKIPEKQEICFYDVLQQVTGGNRKILGVMLESYLEKGQQVLHAGQSQNINPHLSVTDPCLDIATTEELILSVAHMFKMAAV